MGYVRGEVFVFLEDGMLGHRPYGERKANAYDLLRTLSFVGWNSSRKRI